MTNLEKYFQLILQAKDLISIIFKELLQTEWKKINSPKEKWVKYIKKPSQKRKEK